MKKILSIWDRLPKGIRLLLYSVYYSLLKLPKDFWSAIKGYRALKKLEKQSNFFYLIAPFGIGDICFAIKATQGQITNRNICVLVRTQHASLNGLFPNISFIADTALCARVENYIILSHNYRSDRHLYCSFKMNWTHQVQYQFHSERYSLWKDYCKYVYQIPESAVENCSKKAIASSCTHLNQTDIVLMPYAYSASMIPLHVWKDLAACLTEKGFTVYSNISKDESPVDGTQPISVPLHETPAAFENCGGCIAMRSGLVDLLAICSNTKLIVIDSSKFWGPIWDVTFFRKENVFSFVFETESATIKSVLSMLDTQKT